MATELDLIKTWISRYLIIEEKGDKSEEAESLYWAFEQLDDLCWKKPYVAWNIILEILRGTKNEFVLDNLAAGPLESLLARHGSKFIAQVELEANSNRDFRKLLAGVWENQMPKELWEKIQQLLEPRNKWE